MPDTQSKPAAKPVTADARAKATADIVRTQNETALALEAQHDAKIEALNAKIAEMNKASGKA